MNNVKETIVLDESISQEQRDDQYAKLRKYIYSDRQYFEFGINLETAIPLDQRKVKFLFGKGAIEDAIDSIFPYSRKVTYHGATSYQYVWLIKLSKPFTRKDFASGRYEFRVEFANGCRG